MKYGMFARGATTRPSKKLDFEQSMFGFWVVDPLFSTARFRHWLRKCRVLPWFPLFSKTANARKRTSTIPNPNIDDSKFYFLDGLVAAPLEKMPYFTMFSFTFKHDQQKEPNLDHPKSEHRRLECRSQKTGGPRKIERLKD